MQNPDIRNKARTTWLSKYGEYGPYKAELDTKRRETMLSRYGAEYYLQTPEGRNKLTSALLEKYGVENFSESASWKAQCISDPSKVENLLEFQKDPRKYIVENFQSAPTLRELCKSVGCANTVEVSTLLNNHHCENLVAYVYPYLEEDVYNYLREICPQLEIQRNTHSVISPYELDLYIPEKKFAIECNPTSTHNSSVCAFQKDGIPTSPSYHKQKTEMCEKKGVRLLHLFSYDWVHKNEIMKSMLASALGAVSRRVYARNTSVKLLDDADCRKFLMQNHRQGYSSAEVRYGLYYENTLSAVMTFSRSRKVSSRSEPAWELVRFCNALNTTVVGGASKLFKHFLRDYAPESVISYSDRARTSGNLYSTLGFHEVSRSGPGYVWVDIRTDKAYNRMNAQKRNIRNFLKDDTIDLNKTEREIMTEHGYVQVFDSGVITWEWQPCIET